MSGAFLNALSFNLFSKWSKKLNICFLSFLLFVVYVHSQKDYKGVIFDVQTKQPIPYVNIGIVGKGVGTVSDEHGVFHLELNPLLYTAKDTLLISSLGYQSVKMAVPELKFVYNEYPKIFLQSQSIVLDEVVLTDLGAYETNPLVGYKNYGEETYGYWKDNIALGGELATKIRVRKGLRKLNKLFFEVWENASDSLLIRVNIYDAVKSSAKPGNSLNTSGQNMLYTIRSDTKIAHVDLRPYQIYVRNDFIVGIELLKVYGSEEISLILAAAQGNHSRSYRKYASQDNWEIIEGAMAYTVQTTLYSKKTQERQAAKDRRTKNQKEVRGFVLFGKDVLPNVIITNYNLQKSTSSDSKGRYKLVAQKGDLIGFEAEGKKDILVKVLDKTTINIRMSNQ